MLVANVDTVVIEPDDAAFGDCHSKDVARQIAQHGLGAVAPGRAMDDPGLPPSRLGQGEIGRAFAMWQGILPAHGFMPAASPKALTAISRTIRRWTLHQRSDKSLQDLANMYNPYIGGWINYYGQFYRAQLRSTLQRIDGYLVRWARRKYKRLRERPKGTRDWLARVRRADPNLFAHWRLVNVGGRTSEAV
jgi:hypothetical protein